MTADKRPNFLLIVADGKVPLNKLKIDLGFSDLGCYGGEIHTPVLDKLAAEGIRFTEYHTASACSPTRAMLMSGTDNHLAGIGAMTEEKAQEWGAAWRGKPGYEGYLLPEVATLPEVLRHNGYHTIMSGKWHLGKTLDKVPGARGFDRSFAVLPAMHNHYAWEPQFVKGNKYDDFLENWLEGWYTKKNMYTKDKEYVDVTANFPKKEGGFFSTITFTDQLLDYLQEREDTPELKEKPFFAYYPFTAPHWPLQAEKKDREKYRGVYDNGPKALREHRLAALQKLGMISKDIVPHDLINMFATTMWDDMSDEEKAKSCRAMEVYAAMVAVIDQQIGRVIKYLEDNGELDNTFVVFMSDNGAEGASYEAIPVLGERFMGVVRRHYDNSLENIGEPNSFVWYGQEWAQASTAPSRLFKMWTSQGGIRVPCLIRYPPMMNDKLKAGAIMDTFGTCMDIMPTMLDLASAPAPAKNGSAEFNGRTVIPMRGKSWVPWIEGKADRVHSEGVPHGWELHGRAALRVGDFKILFLPPPGGKGTWELFNLRTDPGETHELAAEQPEKLKEMLSHWDNYVSTTQVVWSEKGLSPPGTEDDNTFEDARAWMRK